MPAPAAPFHIIIPANNEGGYITACLAALLAQSDPAPVRVIVAANACTDDTVQLVEAMIPQFAARGWNLQCLDLAEGGKTNALNMAEALLPDPSVARAYLDADVLCDPDLIAQIRTALDTDQPRYATGTLHVARARTWVTRAYASVWTRLPFVQGGTVGAGFFAVNGAGRARWGAFPQIISDDTFVRLHFAPHERVETSARYHWPMVEGARALIRVRRRQNAGVDEIAARWPALMQNEGKPRLGLAGFAGLARNVPMGLAVYLAVHLAVRIGKPNTDWSRGR
jgi:glycosyltransferase involved in cell wall biosynthesis